ncbi:T9SS type A sorting domain-containing protein [candidate division KSB1 bacterium]|nr:T9SS type A sorting domain-containing protein [candidate division KSB1 bacterium]
MQRFYLILFVSCMLFISANVLMSNDIDEDGLLVIPRVENGIITLDASWSEEAWSHVLTSELSDSSTIDDYYALFGVLHDDQYLYMYFKITDDWLDFQMNTWNTDAVEMYVDGDDSKYDTWDNIDDYQITCPLGAEAVEEWAGIGPTNPYPRENIVYGVTDTPDGWDMEVALPKDDFMFTTVIGFDIALNDADETAVRENQIWFQDDGAWNVPSSWGSAIMVDDMVSVKGKIAKPAAFTLGANYPNPFNPVTHIPYSIEHRAKVELTVYDILGHNVATLVNEVKDAGTYLASFDATNLPSGIYYYQLASEAQRKMQKMVLLQ